MAEQKEQKVAKNEEVDRISLTEIKATLGASVLEFKDSRKVDEDGLPLRGMVYFEAKQVGLIAKGVFEKDLKKAGEKNILAIWSEDLEKWVFILKGTEI